MKREFHDLAETLLNHESSSESGGATAWGNLGYWEHARSYPQACAALADQLGTRLQLGADTRLLDIGFGCGDQILHWRQHYGVREITGLNLSRSQTDFARRRLADAGAAETAGRLHAGSVAQLTQWATNIGLQKADAILALDCAYHFPSRRKFLAGAAALLGPGGRLGVTDLVLAQQPLAFWKRAPLRLMTHFCHIPWHNLVDADTYRAQWREAGFALEFCADITEQVFAPFGQWLRRYRAALNPALAGPADWRKYEATAAFLYWAQRQQVLRYIVCTGVVQ